MNIHHDTNFNQKQLDSLIAQIKKKEETLKSEKKFNYQFVFGY